MGWPALPDGSIPSFARDTSDGLEPVQINVNQFSGEPTTRLALGVNLPATATEAGADGTPQDLSVEYFDNLGRSESLQFQFDPMIPEDGTSNSWTLTIRDTATGDTEIGKYQLTFENDRASGGTLKSVDTLSGGTYDPENGKLIVNVAGGPMEIDIGKPGDSTGMTQLSDNFAPVSIQKDGSAVGNMTSVEVDETGNVYAFFDTGISRRIFQVPLVDLPNPNGLVAQDKQTYLPSPDSGTYFLWDAGDGPTGDVVSYALEESATDVAQELTRMIQTQRAYSSNAKVIQTVDEMLQETTNTTRKADLLSSSASTDRMLGKSCAALSKSRASWGLWLNIPCWRCKVDFRKFHPANPDIGTTGVNITRPQLQTTAVQAASNCARLSNIDNDDH